MVKRHYYKLLAHIEYRRFRLLLLVTLLVLIIPALSGTGFLGLVLFVVSLSFLLIQSAIVASMSMPKKAWIKYLLVAMVILLYWLELIGINTAWVNLAKFVVLAATFFFVTFFLVRYLRKARDVSIDVIIVSINIYLLLGISFGSLTYFIYLIIPDSYNIHSAITSITFTTFIYYSFITMSTVGYGDITPITHESQTLAYFISIIGQLYVAIIIAFLVGKLLIAKDEKKEE